MLLYYNNLFYMGGTQWLFIIAILVLGLFAQMRVQGTYAKYKQIASQTQMTGKQVAERILQANGIYDVEVVLGRGGELSDFYDPKKKIVSLSSNIYNTNSVAAIAVAAHEVGHAIQHATDYKFIALRNQLLPLTIVASNLAMTIIVISSLFFNTSFGYSMFWVGIAAYGIVGLFQLVTLPVEFNASSRAIQNLEGLGIVESQDIVGAKKMLNAAAFTYVAAFLTTVLTILRFVMMVSGNRSRR